MPQQITIKTPGKLMVVGEFAVLEPTHELIVMAVDRFVYTTITDHDKNELSLHDFELHQMEWKYEEDHVTMNCSDARVSFVKDAMTITLSYLRERSIEVVPFSLSVTSELDDKETGAKYGLGSSAAVVTSVITAILTRFLGNDTSNELIFKLASLSHVHTQGNGSGADIAASTYGGVLLYSSFQAQWLKNERHNEASITKMVEKDWKYLTIKKIEFPSRLNLCIGWTGKPASTSNLVQQIAKLKERNISRYESFLQESKSAVNSLLEGINNDDINLFYQGIMRNRVALATLGKVAEVEIETEKLYELSVEAERLGGAGKLSGAGGGDCGIAFIPEQVLCETLHESWIKHGIKPLRLNVYQYERQENNE